MAETMAETMADSNLVTPRTPSQGRMWITVKQPSKAAQKELDTTVSLSKLSRLERRNSGDGGNASVCASITSRTTKTSFASEGGGLTVRKLNSNKSLLGEDKNDWDWFECSNDGGIQDTQHINDYRVPLHNNNAYAANNGNHKSSNETTASESETNDLLQTINRQLEELQQIIGDGQLLALANELRKSTTGISKGDRSQKGKPVKGETQELTALSRHSIIRKPSSVKNQELGALSRHSTVSKKPSSRKSVREKGEPQELCALSRHSTISKTSGGKVQELCALSRHSTVRKPSSSRESTKGKGKSQDLCALSRHSTVSNYSTTSGKRHEGDNRNRRRSSYGSHRPKEEKDRVQDNEETHRRPSLSAKKSKRRSSTKRGTRSTKASNDTIGDDDDLFSWWNLEERPTFQRSNSGILRESLHGDSWHKSNSTILQESLHGKSPKAKAKRRRSSTKSKKTSASSLDTPSTSQERRRSKSRTPKKDKVRRKKRSSSTSTSKQRNEALLTPSQYKQKERTISISHCSPSSISASTWASESPGNSMWSKSHRSIEPLSTHQKRERSSERRKTHRRSKSGTKKSTKSSSRYEGKGRSKKRQANTNDLLTTHLSSMVERSRYQPQNPLERLAKALAYPDENIDEEDNVSRKRQAAAENEFDFDMESFEPTPSKYFLNLQYS